MPWAALTGPLGRNKKVGQMDSQHLKDLLEKLQHGHVDLETVLARLKKLPYEDLGYAKVDLHRQVRLGVPEVIYCEGKTVEQIQGIAAKLVEHHCNILATRVAREVAEDIQKTMADMAYHEVARIVVFKPRPVERVGNIAMVCAGTSDIPVIEEAAVTAEVLGNKVKRLYDCGVAGIHRLLDNCEDLFKANAVVVAAGMEGALASVVGGLVSCPVVAVPTSIGYGASFGGIAALLPDYPEQTPIR